MPSPKRSCPVHKRGGFTLIEVLLSLGVLAFAVIPLVGLMPIGLHQAREAMNMTVVSQIGQRLVMETHESSRETLERNAAGASLQFDEQGNLVDTAAKAVFEVSYRFHKPQDASSAAGETSSRLAVASDQFRIVEIKVLNRAAPQDARNPVIFTTLISGEDR